MQLLSNIRFNFSTYRLRNKLIITQSMHNLIVGYTGRLCETGIRQSVNIRYSTLTHVHTVHANQKVSGNIISQKSTSSTDEKPHIDCVKCTTSEFMAWRHDVLVLIGCERNVNRFDYSIILYSSVHLSLHYLHLQSFGSNKVYNTHVWTMFF